jgi:hypothetical protein
MMDLWSFVKWCSAGLMVQNSTSICSGLVGDECDYICQDGFYAANKHVCNDEGRTFAGGSCVASVCSAPVLTAGQRILGGCTESGVMNIDTCELGCQAGYVTSNVEAGLCQAVENSSLAIYRGMDMLCTPALCSPPSLSDGQEIAEGCLVGGGVGAYCRLGCADGYMGTGNVAGYCTGAPESAAYEGMALVCIESPCNTPGLDAGQIIVSGCEDEGVVGTGCRIGCTDGYVMDVNGSMGRCSHDQRSPTSSYQYDRETKCTASTCTRVQFPYPQTVVEGCTYQGTLDRTPCRLGCVDGYKAIGATVDGLCRANNGTVTASYQGQQVACVAATCPRPVLSVGQVALTGCLNNASQGSPCVLGCDLGFVGTAGFDAGIGNGICAPVPGTYNASIHCAFETTYVRNHINRKV